METSHRSEEQASSITFSTALLYTILERGTLVDNSNMVPGVRRCILGSSYLCAYMCMHAYVLALFACISADRTTSGPNSESKEKHSISTVSGIAVACMKRRRNNSPGVG